MTYFSQYGNNPAFAEYLHRHGHLLAESIATHIAEMGRKHGLSVTLPYSTYSAVLTSCDGTQVYIDGPLLAHRMIHSIAHSDFPVAQPICLANELDLRWPMLMPSIARPSLETFAVRPNDFVWARISDRVWTMFPTLRISAQERGALPPGDWPALTGGLAEVSGFESDIYEYAKVLDLCIDMLRRKHAHRLFQDAKSTLIIRESFCEPFRFWMRWRTLPVSEHSVIDPHDQSDHGYWRLRMLGAVAGLLRDMCSTLQIVGDPIGDADDVLQRLDMQSIEST